MKKGSPKYENEKANKVKKEHMLNVDKEQNAMKHLKELCDTEDINPHEKKMLGV